MERKSLTMRLKEYFGLLEGQTLRSFVDELKELSDEDRSELAQLLEAEGYPVDPETIYKPARYKA